MKALRINLDYDDLGALLANFVVRPSLVEQICHAPTRKDGRHVATAARPQVGPSFPGSIQGLARHYDIHPQLIQFTIQKKTIKLI